MINELLAPVKNYEYGVLAINLKADALYCSGPAFSARSNAAITFEDLERLVNYAHLYEKKVYITLNTIIDENDFKMVVNYIVKLVNLNVDAIIIQDLGLLTYLNQNFNMIELHASTQMHVHNSLGISYVMKKGISRVVLPRETSLNNLKLIRKKTDIEIEFFVHGALCTSYSGQCYFSYYKNDGSGNKGTCNQNCRSTMSVSRNQKSYALSLRDLSLDKHLKKLNNLVDSFKLEGRLKSKEYVYSMINHYYALLNNQEGTNYEDVLKISFNRTYTSGIFNSDNGAKLSNKKRINNTGLLCGRVIKYTDKGILIQVDKPLYRLDNIRVVNEYSECGGVVDKIIDKKEVEYCTNGVVLIRCNLKKRILGDIYIVKTRRLEKKIKECEREFYLKKDLHINIFALINKPLIIEVDGKTFTSSFIIQEALKQGIDEVVLINELSKNKDTLFNFIVDKKVIDQNMFIVKSQLKQFKKDIINDLMSKYHSTDSALNHDYIPLNYTEPLFKGYKYSVLNLEQAQVLCDANINVVYTSNLAIIAKLKLIFDKVIPILPRVIKEDRLDYYKALVFEYDLVMVSELGMLEHCINNNIPFEINYSLNINNLYGLKTMLEYDCKNVILSLENEGLMTLDNINITKVGYGHIPLMIMDYCPLNEKRGLECETCTMCQCKQHYLYDESNRRYPLIYSNDSILEMYSDKPIINLKENVNYLMIQLTIEDNHDVSKIINRFNRL